MEFELPTTKEEMYNTLDEIFKFYRINRYGYEKVELTPVTITRLENIETPLEELYERAKVILSGEHLREIEGVKKTAKEEILKLELELENADKELEISVSKIKELFSESVEKVNKEAVKKGLLASDFITDKILALECNKNDKIIELTSSTENRKTYLTAEIERNRSVIDGAEEYFKDIHHAEILAKVEDFKKQIAEKNQEIDIYNAKLDEKDDKYKNSLVRQQAELEIQFMQIRNGEYTESELVQMGYYPDSIKCIKSYYNTLDPLTAYNDMLYEEKLITYLGGYYDHLLFIYRQRVLDTYEENLN